MSLDKWLDVLGLILLALFELLFFTLCGRVSVHMQQNFGRRQWPKGSLGAQKRSV
jgi:hypothetical protein